MTHCIAIHSYKGGTGKTTIAANIAALLAMSGKKVAILDLDIYAPSLHTYFKIAPLEPFSISSERSFIKVSYFKSLSNSRQFKFS